MKKLLLPNNTIKNLGINIVIAFLVVFTLITLLALILNLCL